MTLSEKDVCHMTQQPPLPSPVKSQHLSPFEHVTHINREADTLRSHRSSGEDLHPWLRNITDDLSLYEMGLLEARDAAQIFLEAACYI